MLYVAASSAPIQRNDDAPPIAACRSGTLYAFARCLAAARRYVATLKALCANAVAA